MKDSFILYTEYKEQLKFLTKEQKADLLDAVMEYADTGEVIEMDSMTALVFSMIKTRMDRDTEKWEQTVEKRREAGRAGGLRSGESRSKCFENEANEANASCASKNEANEAVYVPEGVNECVSPKVREKKSKRARFVPPTIEDVKTYCEEKGYRIDAAAFVGYYESQNWKKANGQPVSSWKGCVQTWLSRESSAPPGKVRQYRNRYNDFPQRDNDYDQIQDDWIRASFGK